VEALLDLGPRKKLDELPRGILVFRTGEQYQARSARSGRSRPVGTGHRRSHPDVLSPGGHPAAHLADVPGSGHEENEAATRELVPDVRHLCVGDDESPILLEHFQVERERAPEIAAAEVAVATFIAQQRSLLLQTQYQQRLELVDGQQNGVASAA